MAQLKNNVVIHGFSGKFGALIIFRQRAGKTIAAMNPGPQQKGESSVEQQATRTKFQRAVIYGQTSNANPETKEAYQAAATESKSAYNVAIADFMNAPSIDEIDISAYTGHPGQPISIKVTDDFKVKAVKVTIINPDGSLVEEGYAVPDTNGLDWIYTTTATNNQFIGDKIIIEATDNPDNLSIEERILE